MMSVCGGRTASHAVSISSLSGDLFVMVTYGGLATVPAYGPINVDNIIVEKQSGEMVTIFAENTADTGLNKSNIYVG